MIHEGFNGEGRECRRNVLPVPGVDEGQDCLLRGGEAFPFVFDFRAAVFTEYRAGKG